MKIKLGDKVSDCITGYEGIVISMTEYLNGCVRVGVQSQEMKDGKPVDDNWFDIQQLTLLEAQPLKQLKQKDTGGPGVMPPKLSGER